MNQNDVVTLNYTIDTGYGVKFGINSPKIINYFHCAACGARNQKGRCFYCKSIPGLKEM